MWLQREIILDSKERGFHIVTNEIVSKLSEIDDIKVGLLNLFILHSLYNESNSALKYKLLLHNLSIFSLIISNHDF